MHHLVVSDKDNNMCVRHNARHSVCFLVPVDPHLVSSLQAGTQIPKVFFLHLLYAVLKEGIEGEGLLDLFFQHQLMCVSDFVRLRNCLLLWENRITTVHSVENLELWAQTSFRSPKVSLPVLEDAFWANQESFHLLLFNDAADDPVKYFDGSVRATCLEVILWFKVDAYALEIQKSNFLFAIGLKTFIPCAC